MKLVLGGVRSGKSEFAERLVRDIEAVGRVLYIATSKNDFGMEARIEAHRRRRPSDWFTLEKYSGFDAQDFEGCGVALLDCAGVMATNNMFDIENIESISLEKLSEGDIFERVWREFDALLTTARAAGTALVVVSNEVGSGLVSEHRIGNQFRDLLGGINKALAAAADEVYFMVAGIPLKIKPQPQTSDGSASGGEVCSM